MKALYILIFCFFVTGCASTKPILKINPLAKILDHIEVKASPKFRIYSGDEKSTTFVANVQIPRNEKNRLLRIEVFPEGDSYDTEFIEERDLSGSESPVHYLFTNIAINGGPGRYVIRAGVILKDGKYLSGVDRVEITLP